ncbi:nucleoporin NDC1 isoform X2 [Esox lucius]|uniref:nucleoporin NDC1 isoform X2 n=1 Tax=Esox lucius TaxID=8010 RepID=UPI0014769A5D|nr:nucleoporin NDC1 isoform X2 [Esox lucius]
MFSADQRCWFVRKVIFWRAVASIAWSVLLLPPTTALYVVLSRFSLFHPLQWLTECLTVLTSASAIFSFILLCGVVLLVGFFNLEYYSVVPSIACSKIALLGHVLHPRQFFHSLVHCIMGVVVAWCCAVTIGGRYQALGYPCMKDESGPQMCLNENHLVLLLAGAFVGYSHSLLGLVHNMNYISFHTVQQYKYLCFKGTLPLVMRASAVQALYSLRNFLALYFFMGYVPRAWVCRTLDLQVDSSVYSLDCVSGLLDLSLLYQLWISASFLLFTWYITVLLFRIFVTEAYSFPVQPTFQEDAHQCLPEVITGKQPTILKFLALQDLARLSNHCPSRRQEVFSLSQPDSQLNGSPPASPASSPAQLERKPSFLVTFLQNRKYQVKQFLAKRVVIMYLFYKLPEASSQALFADSQAHIWALEGLSHLVAASYSEDQYGVVQTTLPSILSAMLMLQEAVDRHFKLPHASSKPGRSSFSMGDSSYKTLRFALRATLKTSIYRITATFGEHLNAVQMSSEHRKRLQNFLEYKE